MNILDTQFRSKSVGLVTIISSSLILVFTLVSSFFLISLALGSQTALLTILPFSLITLFVVYLSILSLYVGVRYFKGKPFKKNRSLGNLLILFGVFYFVYTLITYIFSNLTGNMGGELQPVIAFFWATVSIPFGFVIRNGCKK